MTKWDWPRVRQIAVVPSKSNGGPPGRGRGGNGGSNNGKGVKGQANVGTASGTSNDADGTTLSWSHTCTGNNKLLIVHASFDRPAGGLPTVSGVTYNGVAMTVVPGASDVGSQNGRLSVWYLVAPASGSNTVTVTWSGSGGTKRKGESRNFDSVDQVTPLGTPAITTGGDAFPTATITDSLGLVIDCLTVHGGGVSGRTFSINCAQTQQYNTSAPTGGTGHGGGYKRVTGAVTMCWAVNTGAEWRLLAVAVNGA